MKDLPPLQFLPALEAAARLESFRAAADELHITPSAVSQQIKALEETLGTALFERSGRSVRLTAEGARYARQVRDTLAELARASRHVRRRGEHHAVRLHTTAFFAHELVIPQLSTFRQRFGDRERRVETAMEVVDLDDSGVDAALRVGDGRWARFSSTKIGDVRSTPVCAPRLARRIQRVPDLLDQTLIEVRGARDRGWALWLRGRGQSVDPGQVLRFETYFETLRAAEEGLGVAFGVLPVTNGWIASKRLAAPLSVRIREPKGLFLVHRHEDRTSRVVQELVGWLRDTFAALPPV